jgi:hypothetical protein
MSVDLNIDALKLFVAIVLPGLISMQVYRLVMPARPLDWDNAVLEGLFYSLLNLILSLPILWPIHRGNFPADHPWLYICAAGVVILVLPILWPILLVRALKSRVLSRYLQLPFPTAWDFFFEKRRDVFALIHLKTGEMVGGYFGGHSYATSYPDEGDLYLEIVYRVNVDGTFGSPIEASQGLLVRKDEYTYIEFFKCPDQGDN